MTEQNQAPIQQDVKFLHQYTAGALLPLTQTMITAALVFIGTYALSYFIFDVVDPYKPSIVLSVIFMLWTWFTRQKMWISLATLERMTGIDINGDGVIGENDDEGPEEDTIHITLKRVTEDQHYQSSSFDIPASREQLEQLAIGLLNRGLPFTEKEWAGPGKPFSTSKFRELRATMISKQLIELKNEKDARQGVALTEDGTGMLEYYLPSPSPLGNVIENR